MKKIITLGLLISVFSTINAKSLEFASTNLPIVIINTNGKEIPDEPKITATMKIIWNSDDSRNNISDTEYDYNGLIGIERRGSSSQYFFPKKQYAVETRDASGDNLNVSLMGFPKENDWILHAPYSDKTMMRNVLTYTLSRKMGWYASRCKFCELVLNGEYQGIYILMEKIKRDDNRVDINSLKENEVSGDDLTGGYVIKIDKFNGDHTEGWESNYPPKPGSPYRIFYQYHEPKDDEIVEEQKKYIQGKIDYFETVMNSNNFDNSISGYPSIINIPSFIDFIIINELTKNVDGYRLSSYLYKDKDSNDPKLYAGPVWDFNLGFGNANYYQGASTDSWMLDIFQTDTDFQYDDFQPPFWWRKLWYQEDFRNQAVNRWIDLRKNILSTTSVFDMIDSIATLLEESVDRNYEKWDDALGHHIWPNPSGAENRTTYLSEVNYMKSWIIDRLNWMDANIDAFGVSIDENKSSSVDKYLMLKNYPNPFNPSTIISFRLQNRANVKVEIYNLKGEMISTLQNGIMDSGNHELLFDGNGLISGIYFYRVKVDNQIYSGKSLLLK